MVTLHKDNDDISGCFRRYICHLRRQIYQWHSQSMGSVNYQRERSIAIVTVTIGTWAYNYIVQPSICYFNWYYLFLSLPAYCVYVIQWDFGCSPLYQKTIGPKSNWYASLLITPPPPPSLKKALVFIYFLLFFLFTSSISSTSSYSSGMGGGNIFK